MATLNKIMLIGRLTRDTELRYTQDGTQMTKFNIAVNNEYDKNKADFIDVIAWKKLAEICDKYLNKGSLVFIEGRLQITSYEAKDGTKRKSTQVVASSVQFMDSKKSENKNDDEYKNKPGEYYPDYPDDSDVPF